jgi:tetratricopeptide (TPR) repeat protein
VGDALDAYARAWAAGRTDACEATEVRREQSAQALDLRIDCYDQRAREVATLVSALATADDAAITRAAEAVDKLTPVESCARAAALGAIAPPPPQARAKVESARVLLDEATAQHQLGAFEPARKKAEAALEAARAIGYAPLTAKALFVIGNAQFQLGQYPAAKAALLEAAWTADAARDDRLKAEAYAKLAETVGFDLKLFDEGHLYARDAEAALARAGGDPAAEVEALRCEAMVYRAERKPADALRLLDAALARSAEKGTRRWAVLVLSRGYIYGQLKRFDESMADYRTAMEVFQAKLGDTHPQTLNALQYIATSQFYQRDFAGALATLQTVAARREALLGPDHPELAVTLNNIANALWEMGRHRETLPYYRRVVQIREKAFGPEHRTLVEPLTGVGHNLVDAGHDAEALPLLERALRIGEREKLKDDELAELRFALARALWHKGDRARARKLAELARPGTVALDDPKQLAELDAWLKQPQ